MGPGGLAVACISLVPFGMDNLSYFVLVRGGKHGEVTIRQTRISEKRENMPPATLRNAHGALPSLGTAQDDLRIFQLSALRDAGLADIDRLPFSIRVLPSSH